MARNVLKIYNNEKTADGYSIKIICEIMLSVLWGPYRPADDIGEKSNMVDEWVADQNKRLDGAGRASYQLLSRTLAIDSTWLLLCAPSRVSVM